MAAQQGPRGLWLVRWRRAHGLRLAAPALVGKALLALASAGSGGHPVASRRGAGSDQQCRQGAPRGLPVTQLAALPGRRDGDQAGGETRCQLGQRALLQGWGQACGAGQVEAELNPGVGGVHRLAPRAGGAAEPPGQLVLSNHGAAHDDGFHAPDCPPWGPVAGGQQANAGIAAHSPDNASLADNCPHGGHRCQTATVIASAADVRAMRLALQVAAAAPTHGDVPIGAVVLAADGTVLAQAENRREVDHDPTAHAEVLALRAAGQALGSWRLAGASLVVTLEPCAMCAGAAVLARVDRLVFGAFDAKAGAVGSLWDLPRDRRLNHRPEVVSGVLAGDCAAQLTEFFRTSGAAG